MRCAICKIPLSSGIYKWVPLKFEYDFPPRKSIWSSTISPRLFFLAFESFVHLKLHVFFRALYWNNYMLADTIAETHYYIFQISREESVLRRRKLAQVVLQEPGYATTLTILCVRFFFLSFLSFFIGRGRSLLASYVNNVLNFLNGTLLPCLLTLWTIGVFDEVEPGYILYFVLFIINNIVCYTNMIKGHSIFLHENPSCDRFFII